MNDEKKNLEKQEKNRMTKSDFVFCGFMIVLMVSNVISMSKTTNSSMMSIDIEKSMSNFPYMMGFGSILYGFFGILRLIKTPR